MKRVLALSLSLFTLANTITVSQTQALPKPVKFTGKVLGGLACAGISTLAGLGSIACFAAATAKSENFAEAIVNQIYQGPRIQNGIGLGLTAVMSGLLSAWAFKSAYDTAIE